MSKYQRFEHLPVWLEAKRLYNTVLDLLEQPVVPFTYGFRSQLERAALSVSNNIAEGFERSTTSELKAFIAIARGSAGEVRSMIAVIIDRPGLKGCIHLPGFNPGWSDEDRARPGTMPDENLASLIGRAVTAIKVQRQKLGIRSWRKPRSTREDPALPGQPNQPSA